MSTDLHSFITPTDLYPLYPTYDNPYFTSIITNKKEFADLKLKVYESDRDVANTNEYEFDRDYLMHQISVSRFMSKYTPYRELLLYHEPGTGKTLTAINVAERLLENNAINGVIVLCKSKEVYDNFKYELLFKSPDRAKYEQENSYKRSYKFYTYQEFANDLVKYDFKEERYNRKLYIIDEAHNIISHKDKSYASSEEKKGLVWIYNNLNYLFKTIPYRRLLFLTGTPIVDTPDEIVTLFNLMLPANVDPIKSIDDKDYLSYVFKGRISHLRLNLKDIEVKLMGKDKSIPNITLKSVAMSKYQSEIALGALYDSGEHNFYTHAKNASLIVDKSGNYGTTINIDPIIAELNWASTYEEKLSTLAKYSTLYAKGIDIINKHSNRNVYCYIEYIEGGGIEAFTAILNTFGYTNYTSSRVKASQGRPRLGTRAKERAHIPSPVPNRYSVITGKIDTYAIDEIKRIHNLPDNLHGKYNRIIIGSQASSEAYSFMNTPIVIVFTNPWNYARADQITKRVIRHDAFDLLKMEQGTVQCKIYYMAAIPDPTVASRYAKDGRLSDFAKDDYSVNKRLYRNMVEKDVAVKAIEKLMHESSYDCMLNMDRNMIPMQSSTRACYYQQPCVIRCNTKDTKLTQLLDTYNNYYANEYSLDIIDRIAAMARSHSKSTMMSIRSLVEWDTERLKPGIDVPRITPFRVLNTLSSILSQGTMIDRYGYNLYKNLRLYNSSIYFTDYIKADVLTGKAKYDASRLIVSNTIDLDLLERKEENRNSILHRDNSIRYIIDNASVELIVKLVETAIEYQVIYDTVTDKTREILAIFSSSILYGDGSTYHSLLLNPRRLIHSTHQWTNVAKKDRENEYNDLLINRFGHDNDYFGVIVLRGKKKGKFKIRELTPNLIDSPGRECKTYTEIVEMMEELDLPIGGNRDSKCDVVKQYFIDNDKMMYTLTDVSLKFGDVE